MVIKFILTSEFVEFARDGDGGEVTRDEFDSRSVLLAFVSEVFVVSLINIHKLVLLKIKYSLHIYYNNVKHI